MLSFQDSFDCELIYAEKISDLEQKLKYDEDQIQRKDEVIAELEAQLEAATISTACQTQIDEISVPVPITSESIDSKNDLRHSLNIYFSFFLCHGKYILSRLIFLTTPPSENFIIQRHGHTESNSGERGLYIEIFITQFCFPV